MVKLVQILIPVKEIFSKLKKWQDFVLFGGEDYKLVACVPQEVQYDFGTVIGEVVIGHSVDVKTGDKVQHFDLQAVQEMAYKHFE